MKRSLRSRSLNGSLQLETLTWNYCQCQIAGGNWAQPSLIVSRTAQRHPEKKIHAKLESVLLNCIKFYQNMMDGKFWLLWGRK